jgi:two-component system, cell cycle response regulator
MCKLRQEEIPVLDLNNRAAPASAQAAPGTRRDRGDGRPARAPSRALQVLVVDDNPDNAALMSRVLSALGHIPLTALTAEEGLAMALRERPDVVLLDIVLPGMDGHQVMRLMKAAPELARTPIIALTALTTPGHPTRALAEGFDGYLQKPIDLERVAAAIERVVRA